MARSTAAIDLLVFSSVTASSVRFGCVEQPPGGSWGCRTA